MLFGLQRAALLNEVLFNIAKTYRHKFKNIEVNYMDCPLTAGHYLPAFLLLPWILHCSNMHVLNSSHTLQSWMTGREFMALALSISLLNLSTDSIQIRYVKCTSVLPLEFTSHCFKFLAVGTSSDSSVYLELLKEVLAPLPRWCQPSQWQNQGDIWRSGRSLTLCFIPCLELPTFKNQCPLQVALVHLKGFIHVLRLFLVRTFYIIIYYDILTYLWFVNSIILMYPGCNVTSIILNF